MMTMSKNYFPEDVTVQILLKLPVKSLVRFTCVRKSWYKLIKSNSFIHKHLDHNREEFALVLHHSDSDFSHEFLSNDLSKIVHRDFYNIAPNNAFIVGHCNGIFCFYEFKVGKGATLWNPTIRETRTLPPAPIDDKQQQYYRWYSLELGWDCRTNDYKVVVFLSYYSIFDDDQDHDDDENIVLIYSMNDDSWRRFEGNVPFYDVEQGDHKSFDGVLYWLGLMLDDTYRLQLFRLSDEVFEEIIIPDFLQDSFCIYETLGIYNDRIAIICGNRSDDDENCFNIWVLSDSGWSKAFNFRTFENIDYPLGIWNQVVLAMNDDDLMVYDPRSKWLGGTGISGINFQIHPYKESLISVKRTLRRLFT